MAVPHSDVFDNGLQWVSGEQMLLERGSNDLRHRDKLQGRSQGCGLAAIHGD